MKHVLSKFLPVIIIFIFTFFFIQLSFYPNTLRYGEEQALINYNFINWRYSSIWSGLFNFGNITPSYFATLTLGTFWKIASFFHLDLVSTQRLFYFLFIFFIGYFFYLFIHSLTRNRFLSLLLSLIYITTYHFYGDLDTTPKVFQFLILPSFLWCWTSFIKTVRIRYLVLNLILIIVTLSIAINPPQIVGAYSLVISFIVLFYASRENWRKIVLFQLPYLLTILMVAAVDLLAFNNNSHLFGFNPFSIPWSAPTSPIFDILRFFGSWGDYSGSTDVRYYNHLFNYYHSPFGLAITYLPAFILFILILTKSTLKKSYRLSVLVLLMLFLLFTKGNSPPFNFIYNNLTLINFLKIFREPWAKFIINIIFSVYVGIAILTIEKTKQLYRLVVGLLVIYLFFQAYPVFIGQALDHRYVGGKAADVVIPKYWLNFSSYSKNYLKDKRILILPASINKGERLIHNWRPFHFTGYPEQLFINADIIDSSGNDSGETELMNRYFRNLSPSLLSLSSVDYVLFKRDAIINGVKTVGLDPIKDSLDLDKKMTFGQLDLYPLKNELKMPKIRPINQLIQVKDPCSFSYLKENYDLQNTVILSQKDIQTTDFSPEKQISYRKINDTTYQIFLPQRSNKDLGLVFGDLYNDGWQLYRQNNIWDKPLSGVTHLPANCFLNFFIIPKQILTKDDILYIHLSHQSTFEKIKLLYVTALLIYIFLSYVYLRKNFYDKSK